MSNITELPKGTILNKQYIIKKLAGYGANGLVYKAMDRNHHWVAIKQINNRDLNKEEKKAQQKEIRLHSQLSHEGIIQLLDVFDQLESTFLVMEFCDQGDLFDYIIGKNQELEQSPELSKVHEHTMKKYFLQLIDSVQYLHNKNIYHRDLKPENILLKKDGIKLCDFGLSTNDLWSFDYGCGSAFYMSPECADSFNKEGYSTIYNDVWSLGIILVNMMCGQNPWKQAVNEDKAFLNYKNNKNYLINNLQITTEFYHILVQCFDLNQFKRPSLLKLKSMVLGCKSFIKNDSCPSVNISATPSLCSNDHSDLETDKSFDKDWMYSVYFDNNSKVHV